MSDCELHEEEWNESKEYWEKFESIHYDFADGCGLVKISPECAASLDLLQRYRKHKSNRIYLN